MKVHQNRRLRYSERQMRQKESKETIVLNKEVDHMGLIDIHSSVHTLESQYTFLSSVLGVYSRTDHN